MAILSTHIPDDWPFLEKLNEIAPDDTHGARSRYLRETVERDLAGKPAGINPSDETVLIFLTRRLCGDIKAEDMERAMRGRDQRKELAAALEELIRDYELMPDTKGLLNNTDDTWALSRTERALRSASDDQLARELIRREALQQKVAEPSGVAPGDQAADALAKKRKKR